MPHTYINVRSCFVTGIVLGIVTVIVVALRLIVRWRLSRNHGSFVWSQHLDDISCLLALPPTVGVTIAMVFGAARGVVGGHNDPVHVQSWFDSTTPTLELLEKLVYIIFILQPLALGFTKLAFLFFYRRLFVFSGFQMTSLVFIVLVIMWMILFFFGFIFDCGLNFPANWGSLATISEQCKFGFEATIIFTITDACFDLFILVLPLPWIWRLRLPNAQKFQLCGVFSLGGLAVAASVVRMAICIKQSTPTDANNEIKIMGMPTWDIIGITSHGLYWTVVGTNVALIACCLPVLRPITRTSIFVKTLGAFSQKLGTCMGCRSGARDATKEYSSNHNKSKRSPVVTVGSAGKRDRIGCHIDDLPSDSSLIQLGKMLGVEQDAPDPHTSHDALTLDLEKQTVESPKADVSTV